MTRKKKNGWPLAPRQQGSERPAGRHMPSPRFPYEKKLGGMSWAERCVLLRQIIAHRDVVILSTVLIGALLISDARLLTAPSASAGGASASPAGVVHV